MDFILRRLGILTWPIWVKLVVGFLLAVLVPMSLILLALQNEARAIHLEDTRTYMVEKGEDQLAHIEEGFSQAREILNDFINNPTYYDLVLRVTTSGIQAVTVPGNLIEYMDNQIAGNALSEVIIVDSAGLVLASSTSLAPDSSNLISVTERRQPVYERGTNLSQSAGYAAGITARNLGEDQRLALDVRGARIDVYITNVFRYDGRALAYIIGRLNLERALIDVLAEQSRYRPTLSYLVTLNGDIIAPPEAVTDARRSLESGVLTRTRDEGENVAQYAVAGRQVVGHIAQVSETPFLLVTETNLNAGLSDFLNRLYSRGFMVAIVALVVALALAFLTLETIVPPLRDIEDSIRLLGDGDFTSPVPTAARGDEIGKLSETFVAARDQLNALIDALQGSVQARIRDLRATQEVTRFAATQRDLQALMDNVVNLIVDRFPNIYHAQIFLLNDERTYAVLRASTGEAGRQLLRRGHRLGVGSVSVIGRVTSEGTVIIARDIGESEVHRRNEFLPDTQAELAIPLRVGDTLIGALDVQSKEGGSFTDDQINVLETMADQIAVAIENARLYQESLRRLAELAATNQQVTFEAWNEYLNARRARQLTSQAGIPTGEDFTDLQTEALTLGKAVVGELTERSTVPIAVPIELRGQPLGVVEWELPAPEFDEDKVQLAQELVDRLAVSLDNARLFQESRRAILRERLVNEITARLTTQTNIDDILQTAVREVGQALRVPNVSIHLQTQGRAGSPRAAGTTGTTGTNGNDGEA